MFCNDVICAFLFTDPANAHSAAAKIHLGMIIWFRNSWLEAIVMVAVYDRTLLLI